MIAYVYVMSTLWLGYDYTIFKLWLHDVYVMIALWLQYVYVIIALWLHDVYGMITVCLCYDYTMFTSWLHYDCIIIALVQLVFYYWLLFKIVFRRFQNKYINLDPAHYYFSCGTY